MLPTNFHKTFVPERRLIGALLEYAALGKGGDLQTISRETGIPMGASTGKVPAIIDYARGMGLIYLQQAKGSAIRQPVLTPFGRVVALEDRFLGEKVTQWLAHMNLCRGDIGAVGWHAAFATGRAVLGRSFTRPQLEAHLVSACGPGNDRIGPLVGAYLDDAALGRAGVLRADGDQITRNKAPVLDGYAIPYSALILSLLDAFFPNQGQITFTDFRRKTLWFDVCLWDECDVERAFALMERKGYLGVDRQMRPWIIERKSASDEVWPRLFDEMS
ncbi:MAG TPA: hypothetical protein GX715_20515 [Armatimonadetes bacterium]|jgi:hypothetical protein|nr:hypothetical protein [Armatimonadota bacterium]HHX42344.1 hypothetical protein [Armatimonadota bacterium]